MELKGRSSRIARSPSGSNGNGITRPDNIQNAAGSSRETPSPEIVQNNETETVVTTAADSSRPKATEGNHTRKCTIDAGPRIPKNSQAMVNNGTARINVGPDRLAIERQYQAQ